MKKITLVLLFCFCAVGFSQAQTVSESSSGATSHDSESVFKSIIAPEGATYSKVPRPVVLTGKSSELERVLSAPKSIRQVETKKDVSAVARLLNDTFNTTLLSGVTSYENYTPGRGALNGTSAANNRQSLVVNHQGRMAITTYTDLATFEADAGMLTSEDFTGGSAAGVNDCGPGPMSSVGGTCFGAGELEEGFEITASNGVSNVLINAGTLPNTTVELVGAFTFTEFGTITFTGDPVFEVGMILYNFADVDTDLRIFDTGGILLDTFTINNTVQSENFIGLISTDAIGFMEIEGANGSGELIGNFLFSAPSGGGGGGGMACSQENPLSANAGGGMGSSVDSDFKTASDIVVTAGENFTIDTIDAYFLTFAPSDPPTTAIVAYYEDAGGLPGALLGTETVVPTIISAQPWANPVADQYETTMSVTPFTFAGDAGSDTTYWIEISMGTATNQATVFWEYTNDTPVVGNSAAQFDGTASTWSIPDPLQETVYSYEGECTPIGGGGMACNQENPLSANAGGGMGSSVDSDFKTASDIVVTAGEDFTIDTIDAYFLTFAPSDPPTTAIVAYYEDAGGLPGALLGTETVVPTIISAQPWANPVADQYETTMPVTPFTFAGDAGSDTTYWIEISMGTATNQATVFWEYTNDTPVVGNSAAQFDGTAGTWSIPDPIQETVYSYSGECTPISGPPVLSLPLTFEGQTVPFVDFNGSATQAIPNPDASGINTSATVAENFVPATAAFAGVNIVVPVDLTTNKFFAMDVWSPLVDTPVLLKLEGGPNPAVERQVIMTATGAWEEVIFDFSSEGAVSYDSVTIFMNFNVVDAANQTFYWDNLEQLNAPPPPPGPANDLCENAIPMSCGEIVAGTTINATEDSAVASTCDTTVTAPGVWYVYDDASGLAADITITMCNGTTDYDSKLSVYSGDCGALVCVTGNDDTCGLQSEVSFQSDGATTYYILVHGFGTGEGNFEIEMTCDLLPPPNDLIANSIDVDEVGFPYTDPAVATLAATFEAGSPVNCDNAGARGVWYNFVAGADGTATASITTPGGGGLFFNVNNGPLAGSYDAIAAAFGGEFTTSVITEDTVVIIDDGTSGDENDACDPLLNGSSLAGKIAIARRGACAFTDKVIAAQNEGAIAVIVVNNQPGGPIVMGGANPDITIPALMLGDVDGEAVIAEVLGGGSLNVSMGLAALGFNAVTFYTAPNETAVETDLELVDWFENQCLPGTSASIPTVAGQAYYVFVANHDGITDIVIDGTNLGTEDSTIEGFVYYPNPAGNTINLRAQENIERAAVYNMLGQKVLDQNVNAISSELDLSNLATGTYILQVSVNGQIGNYQILKK